MQGLAVATGVRSLLSADPLLCSESNFITLDEANGRILLFSSKRISYAGETVPAPTVISVALDSGERTVFNTPLQFTGPAFESLSQTSGIVYDAKQRRMIVVGDSNVIAVDLQNGQHASLTSGAGRRIAHVNIDAPNNRIIGINDGETEIYAIDLDDGMRTVLFDLKNDLTTDLSEDFIDGVEFENLKVDSSSNRALLSIDERIVSIDLDTSEIARFIEPEDTSLGYISPIDVALDGSHNRLFIFDTAEKGILSASLTNGGATSLVFRFDDIPDFDGRNAQIAYVGVTNEILASELYDVYAVDAASGSARVLANAETGRGGDLGYLPFITVAEERVFLFRNRLYQLEPNSGDRVVIAR